MALEQDIEAIREGIKVGRFTSEAAVSQGIVLRLLQALEWPSYDTQVVWPEYSLSGRRVDFALCHPPSKPIALIEVKQIGQSDRAERQLFEYAFHDGVPMAILTDGREWNFFLPGEQGDYGERRVYKLYIVDRDLAECATRLRRYLLHGDIASGAAIQAARDDYRNVSRDRQMLAAMPKAWSQIIEEEDEMLLEIVADRVESLCGFKPGPDMVAQYLKGSIAGRPVPTAQPARPVIRSPQTVPPAVPPQPRRSVTHGAAGIGFTLDGHFHPARNAIDVLRQIFETLIQKDGSFPDRFAGLSRHGRSRRYLARDASELYPGRPDLCRDCSMELTSGWWIGTNHSRRSIAHIIEMARDVARPGCGHDLVANLGE
jgi:predicted type IV restriction endonuclease